MMNKWIRIILNFKIHLIRSINDPEHPLSLEELNVVEQIRVKVVDLCHQHTTVVMKCCQTVGSPLDCKRNLILN